MSQRFKKILLLGGDITVLYISLWLTLLIRYQVLPDNERWLQHFWPFTAVYFIWLVVFYINGLYSITITRNDFKFFTRLFQAMLANAGLGAAFFYLTPFVSISPKTNFVISLILGFALVALWRQLVNIFIGAKGRRMKTLLIGESSQLDELTNFLNSHPQFGYKVAKIISPTEVLNNPDFDLKKLIEQHQIKVVAAESIALRSQTMVDQLFKIIPLKLKILDLANFAEEVSGKIPISSIGQVWFLENLNLAEQSSYELAKRVFDIFASIFLLLVLSWLMPLIVIAILLSMGRPILFKQKRMGLLGQSFQAIKFRSMIKEAEKSGPQWAVKDDPRTTGLGRILRKTRLDEIPQLLNIIRGEMSFVGPRPERPVFVDTLSQKIPFYNERHLVKPGLTGWAQISFPYGASAADALEKLQYDLYYIKNRSLVFDIAIILKTVKTILTASGQ